MTEHQILLAVQKQVEGLVAERDALRVRVAELEAAALNLCATLRHWHQNGDFECDSMEHQTLELLLRGAAEAA